MGITVVLNSGAYSAVPRQDGSFVFHEVRTILCPLPIVIVIRLTSPAVLPLCMQVPEGNFLMEVYDTQRAWPMVRVEVGKTVPNGVTAVQMHNRQKLQMPMQIKPVLAKQDFFEKRQGFQWSSLLMNPMMIMMLITGGIMFIMPKMMANMDPEELKKMQEMQAAQGSLSFSDLLNPEKLKEKQAQAQLEAKKSKKAK
eukprot:scaffold82946_cov37-Tisochrysis_lutea.AAC.2